MHEYNVSVFKALRHDEDIGAVRPSVDGCRLWCPPTPTVAEVAALLDPHSGTRNRCHSHLRCGNNADNRRHTRAQFFRDTIDHHPQVKDRYPSPATVTTARPLPESFYSRLTQEIARATSKKTVKLDRQIDESLIAGVVTTIGDHTIDSSLKGGLAELQQTLIQAG